MCLICVGTHVKQIYPIGVVVEPELVHHKIREGDHANLNVVGADGGLTGEIVHEVQLLVKVGRPLATGTVQ